MPAADAPAAPGSARDGAQAGPTGPSAKDDAFLAAPSLPRGGGVLRGIGETFTVNRASSARARPSTRRCRSSGNRYRAKTSLPSSGSPAAKYGENPTGDDRFVYNVGAIQSIATSSGISDNGMFELNFHDERYLPFEGSGAVSRWHLELPAAFRQFDYDSISDVLLHLRYTARADGGLKKAATDAIAGMVNDFAHAVGSNGLFQTLSVRDQFPDAWWQLAQVKATTLKITPTHLPYWVRDRKPTLVSVTWYASIGGTLASPALTVGGAAHEGGGLIGVYTATSTGIALGTTVTLGMAMTDVLPVAGAVDRAVDGAGADDVGHEFGGCPLRLVDHAPTAHGAEPNEHRLSCGYRVPQRTQIVPVQSATPAMKRSECVDPDIGDHVHLDAPEHDCGRTAVQTAATVSGCGLESPAVTAPADPY